jgi:hypothetical protein
MLSTWQGRIDTDNAFLPTDIRDRLNAALPARLSYTGAAATAAGLTPGEVLRLRPVPAQLSGQPDR